MGRTAFELTAEEWRAYQPHRMLDHGEDTECWERAWKVAHAIARLLREEFGATRVAVFGSLAHPAWFNAWSDIDLAAWGIPAHRFYRAVAAATGFSAEFEVDLIDAESCGPALRKVIEHEGIDL